MKRFSLLLGMAVLAGCVSNPGVVKTGPNSYMVSRQGKTGLAGVAGLRAKAMNDANAYCSQQGRQAQMTSTDQSSGPYILGNFPRADIQFTCVSGAAGG
jgi:putative hemolysin